MIEYRQKKTNELGYLNTRLYKCNDISHTHQAHTNTYLGDKSQGIRNEPDYREYTEGNIF
jgi:hypothetical protein